jgi:homoserine kinase type II
MPDNIRHALAHYVLEQLQAARRTERGFVNQTWQIDTTRGRYFVKCYHPDLCRAERIQTQHKLIAHLRRAGFPAPALIPTRDGDTLLSLGTELYEVQEYVAGTTCEPNQPEHQREAARVLALYHTCTADFPAGALGQMGVLYDPTCLYKALNGLETAWHLTDDPFLSTLANELRKHADDLSAHFATHTSLPHLITHGDYYADNLIFRGNRITGVVDYDKARWQPRVVELAEALIYFASPRPGTLHHLVYPGPLQWEPFERFLGTYIQDRALEESEARALPDYVRCIWLQISVQRLQESGARPQQAAEALREALILGEWAVTNARKMIELGHTH